MKLIYTLAFTLLTSVGFAQSVNNEIDGVQFFSQVLMSDDISSSNLESIQEDLNQNPNIRMVRVDQINNTVYIITKTLDTYNRQAFESWIGTNATFVKCYRQGIRGVDDFIPFNSSFCNNSE